MDHGGDVVSVQNGDTAVLLFFAGELSVRHHDGSGLGRQKTMERRKMGESQSGGTQTIDGLHEVRECEEHT